MSQTQAAQSLAEVLALANELAEIEDDMSVAVVGGGGGRKLPVGKTLARFASYIEYGKQPQEFKGQVKEAALEFRLGFMLYSPGFCNEDGTPYFLETFNISKSRNEKAGAFLLFKQMNYKGVYKAFPQMLGQAFIIDIIDYKPKSAAADAAARSVINTKLVMAPNDPISGMPYPCPELEFKDLQLFSWTKPTLEGWDKLFIDGTNDTGESKNWIQETIVSATDMAGSPLEGLLLANARPIPKARVRKAKPGAVPAAGAAAVGALPDAPAAPALVAPATVAPTIPSVAVVTPVTPAVAAPVIAAAVPLAATPVVQVVAAAAPDLAVAA